MYNGIINIYKEKGFTSHDVVAVVRGILKQKKVGHTGTLDPEATGVLPICVGKGTKVAGLLTDKDKTYRASFVLGAETDTQDHTGRIIEEKSWDTITEVEVMVAIKTFIGEIEQIPPMYSAIKINGEKLYDLARQGKVVARKSRSVEIFEISDVSFDLPIIHMTVHCSKGTYIRTLCRDIAQVLGTCGHMTSLIRTATGCFKIEDAIRLEQLRSLVEIEGIDRIITPIDTLFNYEKIIISKEFYNLLNNGNKLPADVNERSKVWLDKAKINVYNEEGGYMGIYEWSVEERKLMPIRFFDIR